LSWLHPTIEVRDSAIEGSGLFATASLPANTVVVTFSGRLVDTAEMHALIAASESYVDTFCLDDDQHLILNHGEPVRFGNHSCDRAPDLTVDRAGLPPGRFGLLVAQTLVTTPAMLLGLVLDPAQV
jgi:hypothetical protein